MKRFLSLAVFVFLVYPPSYAVATPDSTAAILHQTAVQTAEHLQRLAEIVRTIKTLQEQVTSTRGLLELAKQSARGVDGIELIGDFHDITLGTNSVIRNVQSYMGSTENLPDRWNRLFGSLDLWVRDANDVFSNIDVSDKTNTAGYLIGDSFQGLYEKNSNMVSQFVENSKQVSEKGALKQIAQQMAQLIQMENNNMYLLAQILKSQSIESSNDNLKRKEEAIKFEQENQGIKAFRGLVDDKTFGI
ncbi:MAG: hypothetical protein Q7K71_01360 [Candidatus Omnitrophota bacterium]|nr:hypothetical protein [Candidatus Omnitrophota bacterium]